MVERLQKHLNKMKHSLQLHVHGEKAFMFPDTLFSQVTCRKWYSVNVPGVSKSGLLIKSSSLEISKLRHYFTKI